MVSRQIVVIHWTKLVDTPNSRIRVGKEMLTAVSTTTPAKDMIPAATTATITQASMVVDCCFIKVPPRLVLIIT